MEIDSELEKRKKKKKYMSNHVIRRSYDWRKAVQLRDAFYLKNKVNHSLDRAILADFRAKDKKKTRVAKKSTGYLYAIMHTKEVPSTTSTAQHIRFVRFGYSTNIASRFTSYEDGLKNRDYADSCHYRMRKLSDKPQSYRWLQVSQGENVSLDYLQSCDSMLAEYGAGNGALVQYLSDNTVKPFSTHSSDRVVSRKFGTAIRDIARERKLCILAVEESICRGLAEEFLDSMKRKPGEPPVPIKFVM